MIKQELKRKSNVDARFVLISDAHITHIKEGYEPFEKTIQITSQLEADGFIFAGDIAYMHEKAGGGTVTKLYPKAYDIANEVINRYIPDVEKVFAIGNHEYPQHNTEEKISKDAIRLFEEKTGHKFCEHNVVCGYHIITVGASTYECYFTQETEKWAMQEIDNALAEDDKKPVFVVFHKPPYDTVVNSRKEAGCISEEFRNYLNSRQRIINIVGDLHTTAQDPKTIWQDGFTVVHCPLCAVGEIVFDYYCTEDHMPSDDKYAQAIVVDICDNIVTMYRIDTIEDAVVSIPWVVDVNDKSSWKYTNARFKIEIAPYFEDDTQIFVEYKNGILTLKVKDAQCEENDIEAFAAYYNIKVIDKKDCIVLDETIPSEYYLANRSGYFTYLKEISLCGKYTIEIVPITAFYKKGRAIIKEFDI